MISDELKISLAGLAYGDAFEVIRLVAGKLMDEQAFKILGYIIDPGEGDPFELTENFADAVEGLREIYSDQYHDILDQMEHGGEDTSADDEADYRYALSQEREDA